MNDGLHILWVSAAALVVTATSLTGFGLRQQRYRGWAWCVAALWLTALGVLFAALSPAFAAPATLLLLQWPVLTLIGVRRFHARAHIPGSEGTDWAVLAVAGVIASSGPLWAADGTTAALVPVAAAALLHL